MTTPEALVSETALTAVRPQLLRYAQAQVQDPHLAEDLVQDTLVAALHNPGSFQGQSSLKTWLVGILKHKLIDHHRKSWRQVAAPTAEESLSEEDFDVLFRRNGHWSEGPAAWPSPEELRQRADLKSVLDACMKFMPKRNAMVMVMRELQGMEIEEICQALELSTTNCSVILYRARMSMRLCMEKNWGKH